MFQPLVLEVSSAHRAVLPRLGNLGYRENESGLVIKKFGKSLPRGG